MGEKDSNKEIIEIKSKINDFLFLLIFITVMSPAFRCRIVMKSKKKNLPTLQLSPVGSVRTYQWIKFRPYDPFCIHPYVNKVLVLTEDALFPLGEFLLFLLNNFHAQQTLNTPNNDSFSLKSSIWKGICKITKFFHWVESFQ